MTRWRLDPFSALTTSRATSPIFPAGTLRLLAAASKLEVLGWQHPVEPATRRPTEQPAREHAITQYGRRLPHSRLDSGVARGMLRKKSGLPSADRRHGTHRGAQALTRQRRWL